MGVLGVLLEWVQIQLRVPLAWLDGSAVACDTPGVEEFFDLWLVALGGDFVPDGSEMRTCWRAKDAPTPVLDAASDRGYELVPVSGLVVAGVLLRSVLGPVGVEVAVGAQGAVLENGCGAVEPPAGGQPEASAWS